MFRAFYGQSVRQSECGKVLSKSSLSMYNNCRVSMGKQLYLSEDFNFARTNCLSLNATLFRMSLSDNNRCSVCPLHSVDLQHVTLECPLYEDIRADLFSQIDYVFFRVSSLRRFRHTISFTLCLETMDMTSVQKWVKNLII